MRNNKGQGFDTFKLLIAAVVAMVILGIVTGVFGQIWSLIGGISCVSNPIGEISSKIQSATSGMIVVTQVLCFTSGGEKITSESIRNRLSIVKQDPTGVEFYCHSDASVCDTADSGGSAAIYVELGMDYIEARRNTQFKVEIECTDAGGGTYQCDLRVINPTA